jgi:hypothetical protein
MRFVFTTGCPLGDTKGREGLVSWWQNSGGMEAKLHECSQRMVAYQVVIDQHSDQ